MSLVDTFKKLPFLKDLTYLFELMFLKKLLIPLPMSLNMLWVDQPRFLRLQKLLGGFLDCHPLVNLLTASPPHLPTTLPI